MSHVPETAELEQPPWSSKENILESEADKNSSKDKEESIEERDVGTEKDLAKRAEILFCYDARMSNPNGDPDENRPRIDKITKRNLVTEFRLKRTIRDYLKIMDIDYSILIRRELASENSLALKYIEDLASAYILYFKIRDDGVREPLTKQEYEEFKKNKKKTKLFKEIDKKKLFNDHIDVKLFGLLFAVPDLHFKQVGPVQFAIGQSLNEIEEDILIKMTRVVPNTREEVEEGSTEEPEGRESGTFGEKYVVRYSFIEFHGFVNNNVAKEVLLTEQDIKYMLTAMWKGTDSLSTSSKFGQKSRLLVKVNYKENGYIGDLDFKCKLVDQNDKKPLENISHIALDIKELLDTIKNNAEIIESVEFEYSPELKCKFDAKEKNFGELIDNWKKENPAISVSRLKL